MATYAFKKGWNQIPHSKISEARGRIKEALGISSDPQFYQRLKGCPEPTISEYVSLQEIFNDYGVTDIWGE